MKQSTKKLHQFLEAAIASGKYTPETGRGMRAALRLFEAVLTGEEADSVDIFSERFNSIYQTVFSKYSRSYSEISLSIYKSRVLKLIADFKMTGGDPNKLVTSTAVKGTNQGSKLAEVLASMQMETVVTSSGTKEPFIKIPVPISNGLTVTVVAPSALKQEDLDKICRVLNGYVVNEGGSSGKK